MSKTPKPIIHSRDHEHGGADPVRIHYESVGTGGGGTGSSGQGTYSLDPGSSLGGGLHLFEWTYTGGDALLDLTDDFHPSPLTAGVYAYNFAADVSTPTVFDLNVGDYALFQFVALGSSGFSAGYSQAAYQAVADTPGFVHTSGSLVLHQDPAEGAMVYMGVTNFVSAATGYVGGCFVQKVT